jgi:hypothetical protein
MQFSKLATLLSGAAIAAAANTITFVSQDSTDRTVYFTGNPGAGVIAATLVPGLQSVSVDVPQNWQGNFYSVSAGQPNVPGMLGEVAFNSWAGQTFFDVSAIVNPNDVNGIKMLYPAGLSGASLANTLITSGCDIYPCGNAYYLPNDVQTKSTSETDLICTLGTAANAARSAESEQADAPVFSHDWVLRRWTASAKWSVKA